MFWQMQQYWRREQVRRHWLVFIIGLVLLTIGLAAFNGLGQVDRLISDLAARMDGRKVSSDVVIVAIDDDSIAEFMPEFGRWPWPRVLHAVLLERLHQAGARVVGLDILFSEASRDDPSSDQALAISIERNNPVVLPVSIYMPSEARGWLEVLRPLDIYTSRVAALAHINLQLDSDGVARSVYLREGRDGVGGGVWDHMALALWRAGQAPSAADVTQDEDLPGIRAPSEVQDTLQRVAQHEINEKDVTAQWLRDYWQLIPYAGGPGSFQRYSYIDVYTGKIGAEQLRGKYVLVGMSAAGLGDAYPTPMGGKKVLMPGVEVIANVLDGLLQGEHRYVASMGENIIYNLLLVLLALPLFYRGRPRLVVLGIASLMLFDVLLMFALRHWGSIQVMPAASLISLMLSYPWWSWRRLELMMRQFQLEFSRMRRENGFFQAPTRLSGDLLEREMQVFDSAAWQLREAQQMVRQSLEEVPFILAITDNTGQVILANSKAGQFFRTDPPLPTLAFEPVTMGDNGEQDAKEAHQLRRLLASHFLSGISRQSRHNHYAKSLIDFIQGQSPIAPAGGLEVDDDCSGHFYLLRIVPRVVTIERSRGWLVMLADISSGQHAQAQRDQALRYLQMGLYDPLCAWRQKWPKDGSEVVQRQQELDKLLEQTGEFLRFEYAKMAIYNRKPIDLVEVLSEAFKQADVQLGLSWGESHVTAEKKVLISGDFSILSGAFTDLLVLLQKICGGRDAPVIRVRQAPIKSGEVPVRALEHSLVFFILPIVNADEFERHAAMFESQMPDDIAPILLNAEGLRWWSIMIPIIRHGGNISVQKTQGSLGLTIEFLS